ncbi:MAG TPA: GtrA family protein [Terracidiphilus sp.]|jgi:putative flippase GtrA|nr:GtrA family protein [Terracidiphilus sp.]
MKQIPHKPLLQFSRYLLVGGFNTIAGYGIFALLNWLFRGLGTYSYMYAAVLGSFISISMAFLGYKWFVFRTEGNYLREWIRCFAVYGSGVLIGLVGLPILVFLLSPRLRDPKAAPYIAAAIMTSVTVVFSFIGHRKVSFRQNPTTGTPEDPAKGSIS